MRRLIICRTLRSTGAIMKVFKGSSVVLLVLAISAVRSDYTNNDVHETNGEGRSIDDAENDLDFDALDAYLDYLNAANEATEKEGREEPSEPEPEDRIEVDEPMVVAVKAPCLGCPQTVNSEDDKIKELALFAYGNYLANKERLEGDDNTDPMEVFVRVINAERQVYEFNMTSLNFLVPV